MTPPGEIAHPEAARPVRFTEDVWALLPCEWRSQVRNGQVDVLVRIDRVGDALGIVEVLFSADGVAIDASTLREVQFGEIAFEALWNSVYYDDGRAGEGEFPMEPFGGVRDHLQAWAEPSENGRYRLPDDRGLRMVRAVHRAATLTGLGQPQKFLMTQLGLPRSTANYWLSQAKKLEV